MPYKLKKRNRIMIIGEFLMIIALVFIGFLNLITLPVIIFKILAWTSAITLLMALLSELVAVVIIRPKKLIEEKFSFIISAFRTARKIKRKIKKKK